MFGLLNCVEDLNDNRRREMKEDYDKLIEKLDKEIDIINRKNSILVAILCGYIIGLIMFILKSC